MFQRGFSIFIWIVIPFVFGCQGNEGDLEPAELRIKSPFEGAQYFSGDTLWINIEAYDNVALDQVKLRVRENTLDYLLPDAPTDLFDWDTTINVLIDGYESTLQLGVPLKRELGAMPCVLFGELIDESGNSSEWEKIRFTVLPEEDSAPPEILLYTQSIVTRPGNEFAISGLISDDQVLESVGIEMVKTGSNDAILQIIHEVSDFEYQMSELISAPNQIGDYELTVFAFDKTNNSSFTKVPVQVKP